MEESHRGASQELAARREAIRRYILGIVRDEVVADDLTQETLLRAHQKLSTLEDPAKFLPWLYRIATNICRDRFRADSSRDRMRPLGEDAAGIAAGAPRLDKVMEQQEMSACVRGYLADLPDSYRAVILLHDEAGMTNPEIAQMLGLSLATVKIRLHRAREKLRATLRDACSFSADERGVLVCDPKPDETGS